MMTVTIYNFLYLEIPGFLDDDSMKASLSEMRWYVFRVQLHSSF